MDLGERQREEDLEGLGEGKSLSEYIALKLDF